MITIDRDATLTDFFAKAALFLDAPEFSLGVDLVDLAARLESCCRAEIAQYPELTGHFFRFKRAVPVQDIATLRTELVHLQTLLQQNQRAA